MLSEQICALYKQGLSTKAVAKQLCVGATFVRQTLAHCNVARRSCNERSPARKLEMELRYAQAAALYMSGTSYRDIEVRLQISAKRAKLAVIRFGGTPRVRRKLSDAEKAERSRRAMERAERRAAKVALDGVRATEQHTLRASMTELRALYEDDLLTLSEIGAKFGVAGTTVSDRLTRAGIQLRSRSETRRLRSPKVDVQLLRKLYVDDRLGIRQVAAELGLSFGRTHRLIKYHGLTVRRPWEREARCA